MMNTSPVIQTQTELIYDLVSAIKPYDALEKEHIADTLNWIKSGASIFRIAKPDLPNKHLVSYFVLFDPAVQKILLVDHRKAQLWLPAGGTKCIICLSFSSFL